MQHESSDSTILVRPGAHGRNDEIEVLRAVGVLLTMAEHVNTLLSWRTSNFDGYVNFFGGVDLFFCISGFVITSAFAEEIAQAARVPRLYWRTVAAFWIRRAYRITPLAWTVLLLSMLLTVAFSRRDPLGILMGFVGDFIAVVFDVANFHYAFCIENGGPLCGPNGIYWSISLEEQFYLVFPFLFLLPRRLMVLGLIGIVAIFAFIPRTTLVWMVRLDAIALGVLLALARETEAYQAFEPRFLAARPMRWIVIPLLLAGLIIVPAGKGLVPFFPTLVSLIALLLVFLASYDKYYLAAPGAVRSVLVWIGQRSFAMYLMHNTVFWIVNGMYARLFPATPVGPNLTMPFILAAAALLVLFSDASFRLLETPLRQRGKRMAADLLRQSWAAHVPAVDDRARGETTDPPR